MWDSYGAPGPSPVECRAGLNHKSEMLHGINGGCQQLRVCMCSCQINKKQINITRQLGSGQAGRWERGVDSETAAPSQGSPGVSLPSGLLSQHSSRPGVEPCGGCWRHHLGRERRDCAGWCNSPEIVGIIFCHPSAHIRCKEAGECAWPACNFPSTPDIGSSFVFPTPCLCSPATAGELRISAGPWSGHLVPLCCTKRKLHCPGFWKTTPMGAPSVPNSPTSSSSSSFLPGSPYFIPSFLIIPPFLLTGQPPYRMTRSCPGASCDVPTGTAKASLFCVWVSSGRGGLWSQHQQLWMGNGKVSSVPWSERGRGWRYWVFLFGLHPVFPQVPKIEYNYGE